jgi:MoaA/NifB/PqqE/SkfB family radical SAM enzyme
MEPRNKNTIGSRAGQGKAPHGDDKNLKHIEISLGTACNNKCMFCLNVGPRKFVPYEQVEKEAGEYAAKGYNSVGFIGGDPTIYPGVAKLGRSFSEMGFKLIHIITNGRRLSSMEFLDELIEAGYNRFSVSVHSHLPEVEDVLTGVPGGLEQKIKGIQNLVARFEQGAFMNRISLNMVMNKQNLNDLDATIRFFSDMGISNIRLLIIRPEGKAAENFDFLVPRMTEVREKLISIVRLAHTRRLNVLMDTREFRAITREDLCRIE